MGKTINLTKVNGCYSKELREHTPAIKLMLKEPSVSTEEMRRVVLGIVELASINAGAKLRFIGNLHNCQSKEEIDNLCYEAVIHGMYYHPKTKQSA
jgi:hypothetical protein